MATRLIASPSRIILDLLKEHGQLTRKQIFDLTPRFVFPSRERLKKTLSFLKKEHRVVVREENSQSHIQPFLPTGSVKGVDHFVYKLNPMMTKNNFPEQVTKKRSRRIRELQYVLSLADGEPILGLDVNTKESTKATPSFVMGDDKFDLSKE